MIRYRIRQEGEDWSEHRYRLLGVVAGSLARMRKAGGPVRQREREHHHRFGAWRRPATAALRLGRHLRRAKLGDIWQFECRRAGGPRWAVVKVKVRLPTVDTVGNSRIDDIYTFVLARWSDTDSAGICARRLIRGGSGWSQHSPWGPPDPGSNAWDIVHRFTVMGEISAALTQLNVVGRVIFNRRIWDPAQGWHAYTGTDPHTSHIHAEGTPERSGMPLSSC